MTFIGQLNVISAHAFEIYNIDDKISPADYYITIMSITVFSSAMTSEKMYLLSPHAVAFQQHGRELFHIDFGAITQHYRYTFRPFISLFRKPILNASDGSKSKYFEVRLSNRCEYYLYYLQHFGIELDD